MTKAPSRLRTVPMPAASAARRLSRPASQLRPVRARRMPVTATMVMASTPRHSRYSTDSLPASKVPHSTGRENESGIWSGKFTGFKKNESTATANARVVTARKSPATRSAGRPSSTASSAPAPAAASNPRNRSTSARPTRLATTTPPTPAMAACPRLTDPLQPVSSTTEMTRIPSSRATLTRLSCDAVATNGSPSTTTMPIAASTRRVMRTCPSRAKASGMRRPGAVDHTSSPSAVRPPTPFCTSSATRITTRNTTLVTDCLSTFQRVT
ncbi:MAG: hypothetical protein R2699_11450 [Acidimicrobiales bacterium]